MRWDAYDASCVASNRRTRAASSAAALYRLGRRSRIGVETGMRSSLTAAFAAAAVLGIALAACGSSSTSSSSATNASRVSARLNSGLIGGLVLQPSEAAPPLSLPNYTGAPVSLAALKGDAVFVTFVYTHCPNVCPLIVSNLAQAQREIGADATKVRFIAVTVDPKRDTPAIVRRFLTARGAIGRMDYLLGARTQLAPVWRAWHVTITLNTTTFQHSDLTYGITASGKLAIVFPSNFNSQQIVHDAALLQRS